MKILGIYTIYYSSNNKIYVGYTNNFTKRANKHYNRLLNNKHENPYLQNSYNKYGKDSIVIEMLSECDEKFLASEEHYWCNLLNSHKLGFNIKPTHPDNKVNGWKGRHHTNESKLKMSKSKKGKPNGLKGKKRNLNSYKCSIPTQKYDLEGNLVAEYISIAEAARLNSACIATIHQAIKNNFIRKGFRWKIKKYD